MGNHSPVSGCSEVVSSPSCSSSPKHREKPSSALWYGMMQASAASQSLFDASLQGDVKAAMRDLMEHATPNCCNAEGLTPLMLACAGGHIDVVRLLLTSAAEVNAQPGKLGLTPLSLAAAQGHGGLTQLLLTQAADVNASRTSPNFPLSRAAGTGHLEVCRLLLDQGADLHSYDEHTGLTAIMLAIDHEHLRVLQLMLQYGAGMAHADHQGCSALSHVIDVLLRMPSYDKILSSGSSGSALHFSYHHWAEACSLMAGKRADVNIIDTSGDSLLCRTLRQRRDDLVVLLLGLQADANMEVPSLDGGSVLMLTITNGPRDLCYRLIARHACVNHRTRAGVTPLHLALNKCDEELCFHLLQCRADPQIWDPHTGETVRMKAAAHGLKRLYTVLEPHIPIKAVAPKSMYKNANAYPVTE